MTFKVIRILLVLHLSLLSLMTTAASTSDNNKENNGVTVENTIQAPVLTPELKNEKTMASAIGASSSVDSNNAVTTRAATENVETANTAKETVGNSLQPTPKVGKHVMANMNPASMILSLFLVLGLIIICALILKRFNLSQQSVSHLKVVSTLRLGTKERLIVVQVGEQQLLLGVTNQQITLLETLAEPLTKQTISTGDLPKNILSFLSSKKVMPSA